MSRTVSDLEAELVKLEADVRASADQVAADPDLTPEGRHNRHSGWVKERQWGQRLEEAATGLMSALEGAQARADEARATMARMPEGDAALAQEIRIGRRMKRIEAALEADGTGPLTKLIADADDAELPFLLEHVKDHHEAVGGRRGKVGAEVVEGALQDRNPDYAAAARTAGQARNALTVARSRTEYLRDLLADPHTRPPSEHALARMSVTVAGDGIGDLTA